MGIILIGFCILSCLSSILVVAAVVMSSRLSACKEVVEHYEDWNHNNGKPMPDSLVNLKPSRKII